MIPISKKSKITRYYEGVPVEQHLRLRNFREHYPYAEMDIGGKALRYIDTSQGERDLLILAGGMTVAEISFNTIEHLAKTNRVIAPDYPPVDNLRDLFDGYIEMLNRLGIDRFSLMGGSYGGWMAQSFVRYLHQRIDKVVLSAIGPPNPDNSRQLAKMLWLLKLAPMGVLRALMNHSFARLAGAGELGPERILMIAQLKEIMFTRVDRKDILAALGRLIDQTENYNFGPADLADWGGRILVVLGSEDPSTPPEKREAMAALYPQAQQIVFEGADHALSVTHRAMYYQTLDTFLAS
jgi:pimeloyl-ACP methyl ester carboxylesterase